MNFSKQHLINENVELLLATYHNWIKEVPSSGKHFFAFVISGLNEKELLQNKSSDICVNKKQLKCVA